MLLSIKLVNNLSCEYLCRSLDKAIKEYQKDNDTTDSLLVIEIKKVNDDNNMVPKIEFKDSPT